MNTINNTAQLKAEKRRLQLQQLILEYRIKDNFRELKTAISPGTISRTALSKITTATANDKVKAGSILKTVFKYGISLLAQRFINTTISRATDLPEK